MRRENSDSNTIVQWRPFLNFAPNRKPEKIDQYPERVKYPERVRPERVSIPNDSVSRTTQYPERVNIERFFSYKNSNSPKIIAVVDMLARFSYRQGLLVMLFVLLSCWFYCLRSWHKYHLQSRWGDFTQLTFCAKSIFWLLLLFRMSDNCGKWSDSGGK